MIAHDTPQVIPLSALSRKALNGERIVAQYRLRRTGTAARELAELICSEHTVELPLGHLGDGFLRSEIVGRIEELTEITPETSLCSISYATEAGMGGLPVLLTLVMGNAGFFPDVELADIDTPQSLDGDLPGPRFGITGLRKMLDRPDGVLIGTALKPLGASASELAATAGTMASAGIEILKEDDGLSNQPFAPFAERVRRCVDAVAEGRVRSGVNCLYFPNLTGPVDTLVDRASLARDLGADEVVVLPGPMGMDTVRILRQHPEIGLPIAVHSAWQGGLSRAPSQALSYDMLFGTLPRLAGADISIMPAFKGRFGIPPEDCGRTANALRRPLRGKPAAVPMPGGGMDFDTIGEFISFYGSDTVLLMSGALMAPTVGCYDACRRYVDIARTFQSSLKSVSSQPIDRPARSVGAKYRREK